MKVTYKGITKNQSEWADFFFERAFEYFAGKIEEDCRAMNGAEQY